MQRHKERASGECRKHALGGASGDRYQSAETAPFVEKQHYHRPLLLVVQLSSERARQALRQDRSFAKQAGVSPCRGATITGVAAADGHRARRGWAGGETTRAYTR